MNLDTKMSIAIDSTVGNMRIYFYVTFTIGTSQIDTFPQESLVLEVLSTLGTLFQ